jgi:Rod binding domain-containing protein
VSIPNPVQLLQAAATAAPAAAKLKKASQDIEGIFVKDLLAAMRRTAKHRSFGQGSGMGEEMYQDIFDQAIADSSAKSGNLGIGKTIYSQMAPIAIRSAIQRAVLEAKAANKTETTQP